MTPSRSLSRFALLSLAATLAALPSCGGSSPASSEPFVAQFPDEGPGTPSTPPSPLPPPVFPRTPVWDADAVDLERTALFGSFPADLDRLGDTIFVTDADAIEAEGARILAIDVTGPAPTASTRYAATVVHAADLVDSAGVPCSLAAPVGFGFFLNDLRMVSNRLGFVLANAGGSDSSPTCSNVVVFDPETGAIRQTVQLANVLSTGTPLVDSTGATIPGGAFVQAGAEGIEYVPQLGGKGLLFVAMSNLVFGSPSFGAVKYPGTVQVFDVDPSRTRPVSARATSAVATQTLLTRDYNPSAVARYATAFSERVLVTVAGTTGFDASFRLVAKTPSSVEVYDAASLVLEGTFDLGLAGLSGIRPAVGRDAAGHSVAFHASSVNGEVYLLRLDGLDAPVLDASKVAVLRGPKNGIPIVPGSAGGPGGNVAGIALSSDGKTLLASGFGDLFAFPAPLPGRLFALSLPNDLVASSSFSASFVPGTANLVTEPGRTLGPLVIAPWHPQGPEVYVAVGGSIDLSTFLGSGPASVGTLTTFGVIR